MKKSYYESYKALSNELEKRMTGPGFDEDGNKLIPDYAPLIALYKEFTEHEPPYGVRFASIDDECELLEKMLDVHEDVEKMNAIMDEVCTLRYAAECSE
jgi:hypothetical protein